MCLFIIIYEVDGLSVESLTCLISMKLSNGGGRLIIASDGIWDALSSEIAAKSCRGLPAERASRLVVKVFNF